MKTAWETYADTCNNWIGVRASSDLGGVPDDSVGTAAEIQHGDYGYDIAVIKFM